MKLYIHDNDTINLGKSTSTYAANGGKILFFDGPMKEMVTYDGAFECLCSLYLANIRILQAMQEQNWVLILSQPFNH